MATTKKIDPALLAKLTHGITGPASTDIERMIAHFDGLTAVRRKRPLTEAEQRVYNSLKHHVGEQFKSVIKRMQQGMKKNDADTSQINQGQSQVQKGGSWQTGSVQSFWVVVQPIINFVKSLFTSSDEPPAFTINDLLKMIGIDLDDDPNKKGNEYAAKVDRLTGELQESIEKLRESVVSGISGAANASMDMVLNAFSMLPGIGTTLLIWRMFQNVLVILGSSLNVQAGTTTAGTAVSAAAGGVAGASAAIIPPTIAGAGAGVAGGGIVQTAVVGGGMRDKNNHRHRNNNNNNNNNRISITTGARALHQSLKRFSGMAARMSSTMTITNSNSNSKTKRVRQRHNIVSAMSAYALKPATLPVFQLHRPYPILKPVAAA